MHTGAGVLLRSDLGTFQLEGADIDPFIRAIVPLLDGSRDREAVANDLGQYSRQSVLTFLDALAQRGLIEAIGEPRSERWRGQDEFFGKWPDHREDLTRRLSKARILLVGLEPWGAVAATELAASGVGSLHLLDDGLVTPGDLLSVRSWSNRHLERPRREVLVEVLAETAPWCRTTASAPALTENRDLAVGDTGWDLVIGSAEVDELLLLRALAHFAHNDKALSLFGYLDGLDAVLGPVVVPGETACWNCARLRQLATSDQPAVAHALQASLFAERPRPRSRTYPAPMAPLMGHLLALEALKVLSRYTPSHLKGRLLIQNLVTLETTVHTVIRMPWCEVCSGAWVGRGPSPQGKPFRGDDDAASRGESILEQLNYVHEPNEFRKLLAGWVDSRTGIIKQLTVATPEATDPHLPVGSLTVLASYTEGIYAPGEPEICSGKGLTSAEAMIRAVGEAIERYSAARYTEAELHHAPLNALKGDFVDPRRLGLYDTAQYDQPHFPFARFDPDRPIAWTRGHWLDAGTTVWLPALPTFLGLDAPPEERFCQVTSNGLAAGASLEDAALRAVFELVERDAFMITWLTQRPGRKILLDDTLEEGIYELIRQLRARRVEVELFVLDVGLSIPTALCLGLGDGERWPGVTVGLAAHLSPRAAIRKAILDTGLAGPYISRLMRGGEHSIPRNPEEVRTPTDHALYYAPAERVRVLHSLREGSGPPIALSELSEPQDVSLQGCIGRLIAGGLRVAIADVTSPDVIDSPFRVVRALGLEMQPLDFGFTLRRLANPRLKAMLKTGLNPYPHPLT